MDALDPFYGTFNGDSATPTDTPMIEKINECIRDLRLKFPREFRAAQLRAKYERPLSGPVPFEFPKW